MVTTTASPRRARAAPWYIGNDPEPLTYAPPWSQTSTGRRPSLTAGVQTLSVRQSSLVVVATGRSKLAFGACIAVGPKAVASRRSTHGSGGSGGPKRSGPTGGRA